MNITLLESSITPIKSGETKRRSLMVDPIGLSKVSFNGSASRSVDVQVPASPPADASSPISSNDINSSSSLPAVATQRERESTTSSRSYVSSKSIPISKSMRRTPSEIQLLEDEAVADYRDYCMYVRIVNGMRGHQPNQNRTAKAAAEESVANIMRTRQMPISDTSYTLSYDEEVDGDWNVALHKQNVSSGCFNGDTNHRRALSVATKIENACRITDNLMWPWPVTGQYFYPYQVQQPRFVVEPEEQDTSFDEGVFIMDL